jgi:hypothetical protein
VKLRTLVIIGAALVVAGIALGSVVTQIPFGTPPLGTTANWSAGEQCSPGGFTYTLTVPLRSVVAVKCS